MQYEITGGDNGNYKITKSGDATPVAFVRRNQTGGGYTAQTADENQSIQFRHMPKAATSDKQAAAIMEMLNARR